MTTYVALIRGINVAGKLVRMQDLEVVFTALGYEHVVTYIQSGNVVFDAAGREQSVAAAIERRLDGDLGHTVSVILRSASELAAVVRGNPFAAKEADARKLHVTLLAHLPTKDLGPLSEDVRGPDRYEVAGREVYLWCPEGYGRTKLGNAFWERRLGVRATTRNWNTVTRLAEMARR